MITLRNVLRLNAISSGATGIALATMPHFFSDLFNANEVTPFIGVGVFLIVFAVGVAWVSRPHTLRLNSVYAIVILDAAWVGASVLLIVLQPFSISVIGNVMVAAVALWVLLMAYLQWKGAKAMQFT